MKSWARMATAEATGVRITVRARAVTWTLSAAICVLVLTHLALYACQRDETCIELLPFVGKYAYVADLSSESNIPTWFATLSLALTALGLAVAASAERRGTRDRGMWWALCAVFLYLSLDEATDLHGLWTKATPGMSLLGAPSGYDWVIPGGFVVLVIAALFIGWTLRLPGRTRNLFLLAGALYVAGGLLLEIAGAFLGDETWSRPPYVLTATLEEALEMLGVLVMLYAVLLHLADRRIELAIAS